MRIHRTFAFLALAAIALFALASSGSAAAPPKRPEISLAGIPQSGETLGDPHAPVKMLYFGDPQCPICREFHTEVLPKLVGKYVRTGKLQIEWHGWAIISSDSLTADRFLVAAGMQNHLWDVLDELFAIQGEERSGWLTTSVLEEIGGTIEGFDVEAAMEAMRSPQVQKVIAADNREGHSRHLVGVPSLFVGRDGGKLEAVDADKPADCEAAINRLLRGSGTGR